MITETTTKNDAWHSIGDEAAILFRSGWAVSAHVIHPHGIAVGWVDVFRCGERVDYQPMGPEVRPMSIEHFRLAEEMLSDCLESEPATPEPARLDDEDVATLEFAEETIGAVCQDGLLSVRDGRLQWEGSIPLRVKWEVRMLAELLKNQTGD